IRLVPNCLPQCDGKFCGDDGCGFSCGECPTGEHCDSKTCVLDNCVPQCEGRQCGSNGCGGKCGSFDGQCQEGKACDEPTGACRNVSTCDHDRPVCNNCSTQEYCGTDCACHRV